MYHPKWYTTKILVWNTTIFQHALFNHSVRWNAGLSSEMIFRVFPNYRFRCHFPPDQSLDCNFAPKHPHTHTHTLPIKSVHVCCVHPQRKAWNKKKKKKEKKNSHCHIHTLQIPGNRDDKDSPLNGKSRYDSLWLGLYFIHDATATESPSQQFSIIYKIAGWGDEVRIKIRCHVSSSWLRL